MKAAFVTDFCEPSEIQIGDLPLPEVGSDEVLVKVKFAGLNPVDWKIILGGLKAAFPHQFPLIPGWDVSGVIEKVGENVTTFSIGDEVLAETFKPTIQHGSFADYIAVSVSSLAKKPKEMSFEQAAALPLAALTALQALTEALKIQAGETVLITGGAGGVGHLAIQIAKNLGAKVVATCSPEKIEFVKLMGADWVVDHGSENYAEAIAAEYASKIDCVLSSSSGVSLAKIAPHFRKQTRTCTISGKIDPLVITSNELVASSVFVRPDGNQLQNLCSDFVAGKLKVHVDEVFELAKVRDAFEKSRTGKVTGKIVISV
jgi:2-desacetyl-2-hydroxyethyl bacteriochlorophyllide A dehydrogenase